MAPAGSSDLKIGLVTDVGTLNDHNFNQYSWEGTIDGAARIGAAAPQIGDQRRVGGHRQEHPGVRRPGLRHHRDGRLRRRRRHRQGRARPTPTSSSSASTRSFVCLDASGDIDKPPDGCARLRGRRRPRDAAAEPRGHRLAGAAAGLPGRHRGRVPSARPGHIAAHRRHRVRARPCRTTSIGYENGAKSVNPDIEVTRVLHLAGAGRKAFNDPAEGNTGRAPAAVHRPRASTSCSRSPARPATASSRRPATPASTASASTSTSSCRRPRPQACIVVSAEKKLKKNVSDMIVKARGRDRLPAGGVKLDITTDDVGLSPFHDFQSLVTPELQAAIDTAIAGLKDGSSRPASSTRSAAASIPGAVIRDPRHRLTVIDSTSGSPVDGRPARSHPRGVPMTDPDGHRTPQPRRDGHRPGARDARHHQALSGRRRQRRHRPRGRTRARSMPCWARTARASPRS